MCSSQEAPEGGASLIRGWKYTPTGGSSNRTNPRLKSTGKLWGNPRIACIRLTPSCQEHVHLAATTRKQVGGTDKRTVLMGGERKWYWMAMSEDQHRVPKDYSPAAHAKWREARPFGTNYREDSSKPGTRKLVVRLDGTEGDLTVSDRTWDEKCAEQEDGQDTVLSYSDGSMKDCGTIRSGTWHVKGCSPAYSHRELEMNQV